MTARRRVAAGTAAAIVAGGMLLGWFQLRFGVTPPPASHHPVVVYATPMLRPVLVRAEQRADPVKVAAAVRAKAPARQNVVQRLVDRASPAEPVPVQFTQYCLKGLTRRDNPVREGIVAADPRVFPLGSYVELFLGEKLLGRFLVDDTGGVVKGNIIDIWTPSCRDAIRFGRRRGHAVLVGREERKPKKR